MVMTRKAAADSNRQASQEPQVDVRCGWPPLAPSQQLEPPEIDSADRRDQAFVDPENQSHRAAGDSGNHVGYAHEEAAERGAEILTVLFFQRVHRQNLPENPLLGETCRLA
jgi:hypothetical protein